MVRFLLALILSLKISALSVNSAYNPFEPDIIKVTNIFVTDVNTAAQTQFNNFNTTPVVNTDTNSDVFTSVTSNGVECAIGTYLVDVVLYQSDNVARSNVAVEITVDGISTGIRAANSYIRNSSGHNEASTNAYDMVRLTSPGKIGFDTLQLAGTGNVNAPANQSSMRIVRIDDI